MNSSFLIFSGYNDRCVLALCRYFARSNLDFSLVTSSEDDFIYSTKYKKNVIFCRNSPSINRDLFESIDEISNSYLIYCPTAEFINQSLLNEPSLIEGLSIEAGLPDKDIYFTITSKSESQKLLKKIQGIDQIESLPVECAVPPCVLKPLHNIVDGKTLYPVFCHNKSELRRAVKKIDPLLYFYQPYTEGKSFYLCAYLSRSGDYTCFWQENILQQGGGKSIVLARETKNPGVPEENFFRYLYNFGYYGPLMLELIVVGSKNYYIEINPRFWGPLQLTLDAHPELLDSFAKDKGFHLNKKTERKSKDIQYYYWKTGDLGNLRHYNCVDEVPSKEFIECFDVLSGDDVFL